MRSFIRRCIRHLGYDVQTSRMRFVDGFDDQVKILDRSGSVVFDIGAHFGDTILTYERLFPSATIWAFEPFPESFKILSQKFGNNPRIKLQQIALADSTGARTFFSNVDSSTNSLLKVPPNVHFYDLQGKDMMETRGTVQVQVSTLDEFCAKNNIEKIDALKIDVQGAELLVFRGATDLLRRKAISTIYTEVLFAEHYENQAWFCDLWKFFQDNGYVLFGIYDIWRSSTGYISFGNAMFVPAGYPHSRGWFDRP
jgi:FkbM family methyltransferase